jgi:hypothetical protein
MKQGKTILELAQEITRQKDAKKDYLTPSRLIGMELKTVVDVPTQRETTPSTVMVLADSAGKKVLGINDTAHDQIGTRLGIPATYYRRMRTEAPEMLAANVNGWLQRGGSSRFMVRTMDGNARAILSDKYRPLDHAQVLEAALPALQELGCEVMSTEVTERRLYLKAITRKVSGTIRKVGETVYAGVEIGNSEIGMGSLYAHSFAMVLSCLNGMTFARTYSRRHIGGRINSMGEIDWEQYASSATRRLNDATIWSAFRDYVQGALREDVFRSRLDLMDKAAEDTFRLPAPDRVVEVLADTLELQQEEGTSVLRFLCEGGDFSRWGVAQAVTRASQEIASYDRASELEVVGGKVIEMAPTDWRAITAAFEK